MRKSEIFVLLIACLLFALGMPSKPKNSRVEVVNVEFPQEQEAYDFLADGPYFIEFKARTPTENQIAEVLWLREAAQMALEAGIPYFNITRQEVRKEFDKKGRFHRQVVEGEIELEHDPYLTDYDANEILAVKLPDSPL